MDIDVKLAKLETRLDATLPTLATRHDVAEAKSNVVMWVAGVAIASTTSIVSVMAFMLNKITPPPASAPTPVIVYQTPPPANQSEPPQKIPGRQ